MLHRDSTVFPLVLIFIFFACDNKEKQISDNTTLYRSVSTSVASEIIYTRVWKLANDSLYNWVESKLNVSKAYRVSRWQLDSLICFNKKADKCIMAIYHQETKTTNNALDFFYGVYINGHWYFFKGPVIYAFSEMYGYPKNTPLSFTKLHEIAMDEVFRGYLKKKDLGFWRNVFDKSEYEVNEAWFKSHFESAGWCGHCSTQAQWDSTFLHMSNEKWKYRDTTDYKP